MRNMLSERPSAMRRTVTDQPARARCWIMTKASEPSVMAMKKVKAAR